MTEEQKAEIKEVQKLLSKQICLLEEQTKIIYASIDYLEETESYEAYLGKLALMGQDLQIVQNKIQELVK